MAKNQREKRRDVDSANDDFVLRYFGLLDCLFVCLDQLVGKEEENYLMGKPAHPLSAAVKSNRTCLVERAYSSGCGRLWQPPEAVKPGASWLADQLQDNNSGIY